MLRKNDVLCQPSTVFADPQSMKLCPIHRTPLFLSDGWESVELQDDAYCVELAFLFLFSKNIFRAFLEAKQVGGLDEDLPPIVHEI
jgi:hypothetical protein